MGYVIELSMDIRKLHNHNSLVTHHRNLATDNRCETQYFTHEMEGKGNQIHRSVSVQVVTFVDEEFDSMIRFIRAVRREMTNHIDCIYRDECTCVLLYVSPRYLKKMDKDSARKIKRENKSRSSCSEDVKSIRQAMGIG